jgi:hypothetical protein
MGTLHAGGSYEDRHPVSFLFRVWRREVSSVNRESDNFLLRDLQLGPLGTTTASRARDMCVGSSPHCRTPPQQVALVASRDSVFNVPSTFDYRPTTWALKISAVKGARARLWLSAEPTPSVPMVAEPSEQGSGERAGAHLLSGELQDAAGSGRSGRRLLGHASQWERLPASHSDL